MKEKKEKPEFNIHADAKKLAELIRQASDVKTKIEILNDEIKAIKDTAKEELGLEPKKMAKLITMYHKKTRAEDEALAEELVDIYDKTFNED